MWAGSATFSREEMIKCAEDCIPTANIGPPKCTDPTVDPRNTQTLHICVGCSLIVSKRKCELQDA